jgi:hypothetical protein
LRTKQNGQPARRGAAVHLFEFNPKEADHISISGKNLTLELEVKNGQWWVTEPLQDRANPESVAALLQYVVQMTSLETLDHDVLGKEGWKRAGLNGSAISLEIRKGKDVLATCRVGNHTPLEETCYLTLPKRDPENLARVVRIPVPHEPARPSFAPAAPVKAAPKDFVALMQGNGADWRDPLLLRVPMEIVKRMTLSAGTGLMEFKRSKGKPWSLVKPLNARASDDDVNAVLREILKLEARPATQDTKAPDPATAALPAMRVSLDVAGESAPVELSLQPAASGSAEIQATLSNRPGVFSLPARAAQIWQLQPNDLRDARLAHMEPNTVNDVRIRSLTNPELIFSKEATTWMLKRFGKLEPANQGRVRELFDQMNAALVREFTTDAPTSLDAFGLGVPFLELQWSSPKDEQPTVLTFGQSAEGAVYAKYKDEPFVYRISPILLTKVPTEIQKWQSLTVLAFSTMLAHRIVIAEGTNPQVSLVYDPNTARWTGTLAGRDITTRIDRDRANALLDKLANFNAETWVIDRTPGYEALKSPSLTVQLLINDFSHPDGPPKPRTLIFAPTSGNAATAASFYGRLDESPDLFLITRQTYQTLMNSVMIPVVGSR